MKRILFLVGIMLSILTGCDNHLFTQFFRNPHVVDIAEVDTLKEEQWYEFKATAKALNRAQKLRIVFEGSEPEKLNVFTRGADENFEGGERVFVSSDFPDKEIKFDVRVIDSDDIEYEFQARGKSSGMLFYNIEEQPLMGKVVEKIKIKSNLTFNNVQITWISYTGK